MELVIQFNELKKQIAEREAVADIAQMRADLQAAQEAVHQAESCTENKIKEAVSDKQKEIDNWVQQECHMREQKAIVHANTTAAKNMAEEVLKTLEESRAITKQAEEEKQQALTALVVDDFLNKPCQDTLPPPQSMSFWLTVNIWVKYQ